jgi:enamine deaminase RidA (YjgF/YER057c/UK114 family)
VQAFRNVLAILASQGAGPQHIVKMNTWVVAGHDVAPARAEARPLLQGAAPATTFAYVPALFLPELLVEIEVWAALL